MAEGGLDSQLLKKCYFWSYFAASCIEAIFEPRRVPESGPLFDVRDMSLNKFNYPWRLEEIQAHGIRSHDSRTPREEDKVEGGSLSS